MAKKDMKAALEEIDRELGESAGEVVLFRGIPIDEFSKEGLIKLCKMLTNDIMKRE